MKKRVLSILLTMVCAFGFLGACKQEHVHNYKSYVYKEATCLQGGVIEKLCLDCGDKKYEETPKSEEHDYNWVTIKEATCEQDGTKEGTCKDCGNKQTQTVLKGEHKYAWTTINQATCKKDGKREGVCIYCEDKKTDVIPKGEHQYVWQIIKDATCFGEGSAHGICADCSNEKTKVLPKISHQYVNGVCTMCLNRSIVAVLSEGQKLGYTLTDISDMVEKFGYQSDFSDIKNEVIKIAVKNGKIQLSYNVVDNEKDLDYNVGFAISNMLSDFVVEGKDDNVIEAIVLEQVSYYTQLKIIYKDGNIRKVGYTVGSGYFQSSEVVKSVAINKQNQFLVVFEDNYVVLFGTVTEGLDNFASDILYIQTGNTYSCGGFLDINSKKTEITIAPSHMGKVIDSIGSYAFGGNKYLEKIDLSSEVKYVQNSAFSSCTQLKQVNFGKKLEKISSHAFYGCAIEEITIPATCTEIGSYAFYNCKSLTKIYYEGTIEQWGKITLGRGWNLDVPATEVICSNGNVTLN